MTLKNIYDVVIFVHRWIPWTFQYSTIPESLTFRCSSSLRTPTLSSEMAHPSSPTYPATLLSTLTTKLNRVLLTVTDVRLHVMVRRLQYHFSGDRQIGRQEFSRQ